MKARLRKAIEAQLKAIRWEVAVLEGWQLDDLATRRTRAQALADLSERLVTLFWMGDHPAPGNTKEP